jgi:hypothetical protein
MRNFRLGALNGEFLDVSTLWRNMVKLLNLSDADPMGPKLIRGKADGFMNGELVDLKRGLLHVVFFLFFSFLKTLFYFNVLGERWFVLRDLRSR